MTAKQQVLKVIESLPDDATYRDILDEIRFRAGIEEAIESLDRGEGIPHHEVRKRMAKWLKD
ncbi:MAG: hypothetical protein HY319_25595 [Armatimonadetes bacterium]|nr:hypothetical protein [Armatimonadota bacterium]